MGRRIGLALLGAVAITTLFAEGLLDHPWIDWFLPFGPTVLARPKLVVLLLLPIAAFLIAPRIRWIQGLLTLTIVASLTLTGLDLVLRVLGVSVNPGVPSHSLPRLPWLLRWEPDFDRTGTGWGDLAGLSRDPALRELRVGRFRTDDRGFRNNHSATDIDVVVLGDSFGAGLGTTQDSIFSNLLEAQSGARVYNLSFPTGPQYQLHNFLAESGTISFRPGARIVWLLFTGNDLTDATTRFDNPDSIPWLSGLAAARIRYQRYRESSPIRQLILTALKPLLSGPPPDVVIRRPLPGGVPMLFETLYRDNVNLAQQDAERRETFPRIVRAMLEMRKLANARGLGLTVLIIPAKEEIYRWILEERERRPSDLEDSGFGKALLAACGRIELRCLNAKPVLTAEAYRLFDESRALVYWRDDTHFNDRGHQIITDLIYRHVLSPDSTATTPTNPGFPQ